MGYILAIDQGTTGSTTLLFDKALQIKAKSTVEFPQHFPQPGWVEHDLEEIWKSVCQSTAQTLKLAGIAPSEIEAIGITNQRETTCLWERGRDAKPLCKAIVWQDRRTADVCERLRKRGLERGIQKKTGLRLDPYFSATKLGWMLANVPGAAAKAKAGQIAFGTIETYLLYRMTGAHFTEPSNASRTLLMNLKTCRWDDELLKLFKIPKSILPEIRPTMGEFGKTRGFPGLRDGIPVTGMIGDQQAALFGQACFTKGAAKCTYGTGAFIVANTGPTPVLSKHKLLTSVAWTFGDKTTYCLEGSAFIAGAAVQWLRDGLKMFPKASEVERLAASVPDSAGVVFVPALSGLGAPHWFPHAKGLVTGLTRGTTEAHIARATLESIAFQVRELLECMGKDFGKKISFVKADGGAAENDLLMQYQADLIGAEVIRSKIIETTALGAGLVAGLAIGFWKDQKEVEAKWLADRKFKPNMASPKRKTEILRWDRAVEAVRVLSL